jgi:hypothetical protein
VAEALTWNFRVPYPHGFRGWVPSGGRSDYERKLVFADYSDVR